MKKINLWILLMFLLPVLATGARRIAPVDINLTGVGKLTLVPGINRDIAKSIINFRNETGYFESVEDLKEVPGIDEDLFKEIAPYLTVTTAKEIKSEDLYEYFDELQENEAVVDFVDVDVENLDKFQANPLDLNTASLDQLLELPYVTKDIAKEIIKYRRKKRGFKSANELMYIVSPAVADNIDPFVTVLRQSEIERFHGDIRFRYGVWPYPFGEDYFESDSKYHNPQYFYNRLRLYYGNKAEVGLVVRKDRNSLELNYENLRNYFLIKNYLLLRNTLAMDTIVVGNYSLSFGQGIFIQPQPFLIRRIPLKERGLREDKGTDYNDKFYGVAAAKRFENFEIFGFYSDKPLIVDYLNKDGSVGTPTDVFYDYFITYMDNDDHYEFFGALKEKLYGARIKGQLSSSLAIGGGYYEEIFDPHIDPFKEYKSGNTTKKVYLISDYYFRGDKVKLICTDLEYEYDNFKLFLEYGRSYYHTFKRTQRDFDEYAASNRRWFWDYGNALEILGIFKYEKTAFWINYHKIDQDYYAFHSAPYISGLGAETFLRDEEGYGVGGKYVIKGYKTQLSFHYGRPIVAPYYYSTQVEDLVTWASKDEYEIYWENTLKLFKKFTVKYRNTIKFKTRTSVAGEPSDISDALGSEDSDLYIPYQTIKNRFEFIHEPSNMIRLKWRLETVDNTYKDLSARMSGYMTFGELKYKPTSSLTVFTRVTYWDTPRGVSSGAMEYTWPSALIPYGYYSIYGGSEKNFRWYIMPTLKFSKNAKLWLKYEFWPKAEAAFKNVFKLQYDCSF